MSVAIPPETDEPSPYWIEKVPLSLWPVEDLPALYLFFWLQVDEVQEEDGTQRSEDPASRNSVEFNEEAEWNKKNDNILSKSIMKFWPGEPMEMVPAHSESSSSSIKDSDWRRCSRVGRVRGGLISAPYIIR